MPWQLPAVHHLRREAAGEGRAAAALLIGVPWVSGQAAPHAEPVVPYDCASPAAGAGSAQIPLLAACP